MSRSVNRAMLEYFTEWKRINDNIEPAGDKDSTESLLDESEQASEFLSSVGLANIVTTIENGDDHHNVYEDIEAFLTKNQLATIRKRVDTLKRKSGGRSRRDVRSLFSDEKEDNHHHRPRERAEEESKLHAVKFKRTSPFRTPRNAEQELISAQVVAPHHADSHEEVDDDVHDGHTVLPVFFPDRTTNICLEKTTIDDLGKKDLKMLEALAQIELMGVFDKFGINFTKQKSKRKIKDKDGVFGVRLQTLLERDQKVDPSLTVPSLFHQLLCHMETNCLKEEGILRISGSYTRIKEIRNDIDVHWYSDGKFSFEGMRPNDVSGLMKVFLRDLPAPLLTYEWIDPFIQISSIPNVVMQMYCLSLLMLLLPEVNRDTLKRLLLFLNKVVEQSSTNKMNEDNVAMIMAPNLFLYGSLGSCLTPSGNLGSSDLDKELMVTTVTAGIVQLMMRHLEEMFVVPTGLISQIREKNQESKRKVMKKFWTKKDKPEACKVPDKIHISIMLDSQSDEVCLRLKQDSTVRDILNSIVPKLRSGEKLSQEIVSRFSLHEVGGNIEERRLDPISSMHAVIRTNPLGKFELRSRPSNFLSTTFDVRSP